VFTILDSVMLVGAIELGLIDRSHGDAPVTREFFSQLNTKAALIRVTVGAFAIGRPYPVFRELQYAAQTDRPSCGAAHLAETLQR
jgi:hypothetical protein